MTICSVLLGWYKDVCQYVSMMKLSKEKPDQNTQLKLVVAESSNTQFKLDSSLCNYKVDLLWTRAEKTIFWNVIKDYLGNLVGNVNHLEVDGTEIDHVIEMASLDPTSVRDYNFCRRCIREELWAGRYLTAVRIYRLSNMYFEILLSNVENTESDILELENIFIS